MLEERGMTMFSASATVFRTGWGVTCSPISEDRTQSDIRSLAVEIAVYYLGDGQLRNLVNGPEKTILRGMA
jgi:hypothetical protein